MGQIEFDAKGDITTAPYVMWKVKGGTFVTQRVLGDSLAD
jgi:hypothetical protein